MTIRTLALLGAALVTAAASPTTYPPLAMADSLRALRSPVSPPAASSGFAPAPVPDPDLDTSYHRYEGPAKVAVTPSLFHQRQTYRGDGYTPNSTVQGEQSKRLRPAPGFNLSVPLQ